MNCKNCKKPLQTDYSFCPSCGAKIIHKRIAFRNLLHDFKNRFFNLDNTFAKTYIHMFTQPESVTEAYLDGTRKKYINPISYFMIALTISGILMFFIKRAFPEGMNFDIFSTGNYTPDFSKKMTSFIISFYSFIFALQIPIYAACSYIVFKQKKNNYAENIVRFIYIQSHASITFAPISISIVVFAPMSYLHASMFFLPIMLGYGLYCLYKISEFKKGFVLNAIVYLMLFGIGYIGLSIIQLITMLLTGNIDLHDFSPKK